MKSSWIRSLCLVGLLLTGSACESLSQYDKECLDDVAYYNLPLQENYSPGTAACLNILPGVGNFYLGQPGLGAMNLLLWPVSIVWGIPQAHIDAKVLNQKWTGDWYRTRAGIKQIDAAKAKAGELPAVTQ